MDSQTSKSQVLLSPHRRSKDIVMPNACLSVCQCTGYLKVVKFVRMTGLETRNNELYLGPDQDLDRVYAKLIVLNVFRFFRPWRAEVRSL